MTLPKGWDVLQKEPGVESGTPSELTSAILLGLRLFLYVRLPGCQRDEHTGNPAPGALKSLLLTHRQIPALWHSLSPLLRPCVPRAWSKPSQTSCYQLTSVEEVCVCIMTAVAQRGRSTCPQPHSPTEGQC